MPYLQPPIEGLDPKRLYSSRERHEYMSIVSALAVRL
jgi:hypothetical protein